MPQAPAFSSAGAAYVRLVQSENPGVRPPRSVLLSRGLVGRRSTRRARGESARRNNPTRGPSPPTTAHVRHSHQLLPAPLLPETISPCCPLAGASEVHDMDRVSVIELPRKKCKTPLQPMIRPDRRPRVSGWEGYWGGRDGTRGAWRLWSGKGQRGRKTMRGDEMG